MQRQIHKWTLFSILMSASFGTWLSAQSQEPTEIRAYRSLRTSTMKGIVEDLKDDRSLPNNWPRQVTEKIFREIDKVQSRYRSQIDRAGSAGNATAPLEEWYGWLSKEKLIWSGIKKELAIFASLHNDMLIGQATIEGEVRSSGLLERAYDRTASATDSLFEGVDSAIKIYNNSRFLRALNTMRKLASGNVDAANLPYKEARSELLKYLELVKTKNLVNLYVTNRSLRQTLFERDLPARDAELKTITRSLDRQINDMASHGARLINRKLVTYNHLRHAVDVSAFSSFEKDADAALKTQIDKFKQLEETWDKMVAGWNAAMYTEHKGIARWFEPGFGNSAAVRRQLAEWYKEAEEVEELLEASEELE